MREEMTFKMGGEVRNDRGQMLDQKRGERKTTQLRRKKEITDQLTGLF